MSAVIFSGSAVKALKNEVKFFTAGSIQSGTADPTATATAGDAGSMYINTSSGNVYKKNDSGTTTNWSQVATTATVAPNSSYDLNNLGLATSVAANALTIALKTASGVDASAGSPVKIGFRNGTITNGQFSSVSVTGALSLVVSSGSTLGHQSAVDRFIYVYALNNAGTAALGVSSAHFEDGSLVSTTAEGGAGAADSNSAMYSAAALTGVACRLIGLLVSNQVTAGTWAANMTRVSVMPFDIPKITSKHRVPNGTSVTLNTPVDASSSVWDTHGCVTTGAAWKFTANKAGKYRLNALIYIGVTQTTFLYKNGVQFDYLSAVNSSNVFSLASSQVDLVVGDYIDVRLDTSGTANSGVSQIDIEFVG